MTTNELFEGSTLFRSAEPAARLRQHLANATKLLIFQEITYIAHAFLLARLTSKVVGFSTSASGLGN
jgi:hypothetical protein